MLLVVEKGFKTLPTCRPNQSVDRWRWNYFASRIKYVRFKRIAFSITTKKTLKVYLAHEISCPADERSHVPEEVD